MERSCLNFLIDWLNSSDRKPIIIRGARQVGKTWLIRHLAKTRHRDLIELNIEDRKTLVSFFSSNEPDLILQSLSSF